VDDGPLNDNRLAALRF